MRILGFSKKWPKLGQAEFTTFRFGRRDTDWQVDEVVHIVIKPRSKDREIIGEAEIINKELRKFGETFPNYAVSDKEAKNDGFESCWDMKNWFLDTYGRRILEEPMNKLTLRWLAGNRVEE